MGHNRNYKKKSKAGNQESRPRRVHRYIAVDVWRTQFGPNSVKAVFDIYSQRFNISPETMKKNSRRYSFSSCLNALRLLENPNYKKPVDIGY